MGGAGRGWFPDGYACPRECLLYFPSNEMVESAIRLAGSRVSLDKNVQRGRSPMHTLKPGLTNRIHGFLGGFRGHDCPDDRGALLRGWGSFPGLSRIGSLQSGFEPVPHRCLRRPACILTRSWPLQVGNNARRAGVVRRHSCARTRPRFRSGHEAPLPEPWRGRSMNPRRSRSRFGFQPRNRLWFRHFRCSTRPDPNRATCR